MYFQLVFSFYCVVGFRTHTHSSRWNRKKNGPFCRSPPHVTRREPLASIAGGVASPNPPPSRGVVCVPPACWGICCCRTHTASGGDAACRHERNETKGNERSTHERTRPTANRMASTERQTYGPTERTREPHTKREHEGPGSCNGRRQSA